ncbi:MAG TPA: acetoin utilization protein AcuC [Thermoplasmata archaeon]|nr:acetoin utilization protein AcuC [Thermoplasmata archaeon]
MTSKPFTVVWDPRFREYNFGPDHPFDETSRDFAVRLFESTLTPEERVSIDWKRAIEPAPTPMLLTFHEEGYLDFLRAASASTMPILLDSSDTPAFPGCFEASARIVAGTEWAVRLAIDRGGGVFVPAGGLHHAAPGRASGFCILNDVAIGVAAAVEAGRRVAYVDIDAHHGDGVMYGFYRNGRVLDVDFHQDGRTLFPGTGRVGEVGEGDGAGLKVNVPLPPGAGDEALVPLARRLLPPLLEDFRPDLLVVQHGLDSHWGDPLAQLQFTPHGYAEFDRLLLDRADRFGGRIVVTGGGGYLASSVARTLARVGRQFGGLTPFADDTALPEPWRIDFVNTFGSPAPSHWVDRPKLELSPWNAAREQHLLQDLERALGRTFPAP